MTVIADRPQARGSDPGPARAARRAADRAREHLLALQDPAGWWKGELATNVTMDAEDLLLREFLGIRSPEESDAAARWIRSQQRDDGTWPTFFGGPANLSVTVEAYVALRLAGDAPQEPHLALAARWIRANGGVERTRVFTRIWLALFGLWSWDRLPAMPVELIFLPPAAPLNVYDWACWARQTVVPLTVVSHFRPSRPLAFGIDELITGAPDLAPPPLFSAAGFFTQTDRALHWYEKSRFKPGRREALERAAAWIVAHQEADGCWGGIQPPWVYSIMALHLMGYQMDHPVMRTGIDGLERFIVREDGPDGPMRRLEACQSPVWDTALAVVALADAGTAPDDPAMVRAADWLLGEEITVHGDWSVRRPNLAPGGWAFEFANDGYPDTDDTAEVVIALRKAGGDGLNGSVLGGNGTGHGNGGVNGAGNIWTDATGHGTNHGNTRGTTHGTAYANGHVDAYTKVGAGAGDTAELADPRHERLRGAIDRGVRWMAGMQSKDGGWGAFDADNTRQLITRLPFCDFGAVIDPPSADVTAHILEALALEGKAHSPEALRGVRWLLDHQEPEGSWFGRWGANHVYGTGAVVPALVEAGVARDHPAIRRASGWLLEHQNPDGGWGEDLRSYQEPEWIGRGDSTASQTAWAMLALLAAQEPGEHARAEAVRAATDRGAQYLAETQRADGTWNEELFTGTGFPGDFYINYHLYRLVFPLTALGRYLNREAAPEPSPVEAEVDAS